MEVGNMPKTAVGLFDNPSVVDDVVREIEVLGFPRNEIRTIDEPARFEVTGVMSFPRLEFEVDLMRELTRIGTTQAEAHDYIEGLRRGGALVFATGSDEGVDAAAAIMNQRGAVEIEETSGPEPQALGAARESTTPIRNKLILTRRANQLGGGACLFTW
jgi:hypothetical protein